MKEMIYTHDSRREWLDHGEYEGYEYVIMSLGTHPTAYVGIPDAEAVAMFQQDEIEDSNLIDVHGGITYEHGCLLDENGDECCQGKWWIGWDYAHLYDYMPGRDYGQYQKKWTTEEIMEEVKSAINQIIERRPNESLR